MDLYNAQPTIVALISTLKKSELPIEFYEKQLATIITARFEKGQPGITRCINDLRKIVSRLKRAEAIKQQLLMDMKVWTKKHEPKPDDIGEAGLRSALVTRSGRRNSWK